MQVITCAISNGSNPLFTIARQVPTLPRVVTLYCRRIVLFNHDGSDWRFNHRTTYDCNGNTHMLYCTKRTRTERETQFFNVSCQITFKMFAVSPLKLHCSSLNRLPFTRDFSSGKFLHLVYTMSCTRVSPKCFH